MHAKLQQLRDKRENGDHGFTLIELLVVVVIIGVLVAIAIPLYLNYRKGAENKDAQSDVRNAIGAIENCFADNGNKYPGTGGTAVTSTGGSINLTCVTAGTGTATAATSAGGDQTINISDGDKLTYTPAVGNASYTVVANYGGDSSHKTYTYTSTTGKTVSS